jgi:hypothetical protein
VAGSEVLPGVLARDCLSLPEIARDCPRLLEIARDCPIFPEIARDCPWCCQASLPEIV